MRNAIVTRFVNQMQQSTFIRAATMETTSAITHRSPKFKVIENKDEFEEFIVGESIVGEKNIIGKVKPRRVGK